MNFFRKERRRLPTAATEMARNGGPAMAAMKAFDQGKRWGGSDVGD